MNEDNEEDDYYTADYDDDDEYIYSIPSLWLCCKYSLTILPIKYKQICNQQIIILYNDLIKSYVNNNNNNNNHIVELSELILNLLKDTNITYISFLFTIYYVIFSLISLNSSSLLQK